MGLKEFYTSLPIATHPKREFIDRVVNATGVTETTVRNWCLYDIKPQNDKYVQALETITGIPRENLFN